MGGPARVERSGGPEIVRNWIAKPPQWLAIHPNRGSLQDAGPGAGEAAAIAASVELQADLLLMDDRRAVRLARRQAIEVVGTLAVLSRAAQAGHINLVEAFDRLKRTSFRFPERVMNDFLEQRKGTS